MLDNYDPNRFDDPISYAVKTGDISRGASPRDVSIDHEESSGGYLPRASAALGLRTNAYLGLALSILFLIVAILSM